MRALALAFMLLLAHFGVASAQTATPDSENGRYSFSAVADGVLRLDTRTGQISQCSRSDAGWACKVVADERSALETEIARLQGNSIIKWQGYRVSASRLAESNFRYTQVACIRELAIGRLDSPQP